MQKQREIIALTASVVLSVLIAQTVSYSCARNDEQQQQPTRAAVQPRTGKTIRPQGYPLGDTSRSKTSSQSAGRFDSGKSGRVALLADGANRISVADVVEGTLPSVVNISSTRVLKSEGRPGSPLLEDPMFRRFFHDLPFDFPGKGQERRELSLGSAVVVSEDGVLLTNNHVVEHADEVRVAFADGREFPAEIVGTDPLSDLAVLRIKGEVKGLRPIRFGDSTSLRLGDFVIAIGNPFGVGQTVTLGIVSAKGRADLGIVDYEDFIQTDAAINPGNSGGALIALDGSLVGVNTAILSRTGGSQGIGFAIPTEMATPIMEALLRDGRVVRGWLGIGIQDLNPALAEVLKLDSSQGVLISDVSQRSPAARAGLEPRDVIIAVDGEPVSTAGKLRNEIARRGAGAKVRLDVLRDAQKIYIDASLGELPARAGSIERLRKDEPQERHDAGGGSVGLLVSPLSPAIRRQIGAPPGLEYGVLVTEVEPGSLADRAGINGGDVILEVDRERITSTRELANRLARAPGRVLVRVFREGATFYVVIDDRERAPNHDAD